MPVANIEPFYEPRVGAEQDHMTLDEHFEEQDERSSWLESRGREIPTGQPNWPEIDDEGE